MFHFLSLKSRPSRAAFCVFLALTNLLPTTMAAHAHEYWIEPQKFTLPPGDLLLADLKNGQEFSGSNYAYVKNNFDHFTYWLNEQAHKVEGRDGNLPAIQMRPEKPGLYVFSYAGKPETLRFNNWQKFTQDYLAYEGLGEIAQAHLKRGLPQTGFVETYQRCAKALVGVGDAKGRDRLTGLAYEFVAEQNPYVDSARALGFQLYWQGKPAVNRSVNIFRRNGDNVTRTQLHTDDKGRMELPVKQGETYLLNAVHIEQVGNPDKLDQPVWHSWWASIVFGVPED